MKTTMKRIFSLLIVFVMVCGMLPVVASAAEQTATLSFASTANRTSFSTTQQVWAQNGITFTNDKASSSSNVADYSNPARLYAKSSITVEYPGMTKIVFTCSGSSYATALAASDSTNLTASGSTVTVTFSEPTDSFTVASMSAQIRISSLEVTYDDAAGGEVHVHNYVGAVTTEPTCTETGVMTYTCDVEGCENPTYTEEIAATGHNWVDGACSVCGEVATFYTLVTNASSLAAGDKIIIVAAAYDYALSTTQGSNNRPQAAITKGTDGIVPGDDVQIITLEAGTVDGTLAFNVGDGYLYAVSTSSNHLRTQAAIDDNASWLITIDAEGIATIKAQGTNTRNWLRYNASSSIFSCYASGQADVAIYKEAVAGGEEEHVHNYVGTVTTEPTCTTTGVKTYTCDVEGCDNPTYTEEIPALGHNWVDGACSVCGEEASGYVLVTDASSLAVGDKIIIVATGFDFALSTTQNSNNRAQAAVTKVENNIEPGDDVQIITLEAGTVDGTFAFNAGTAGYLFAASTSSNHLKTQTTKDDNASWLITITAEGVATIKAQGTNTRNWLRYNDSSSIFSCYGETSTQKDVAIYKSVAPAGEEHTHNYVGAVTTEPTCTEAGVMTYTCDVEGCDNPTYTEAIPATGHDFSKGDCACGEADPIKTIPEANELGGTYEHNTFTPEKYTVEGTVTEIANTTYGNLYIEDADGNTLYIYGLYSADGSTRFDAMDVKPAVGDQIKVYGILGTYNSAVQMKNAWLIHTHHYESVVTEATCESAGYTTHTCADCGKSYVSDVTDFGHQLDEGRVTVEAACDSEGEMTYTCTACGATVTEVIPMLPHTPNGEGTVTVAATCTTDGVREYDACDVCGEGYTEVIPATGHNYVDGQCTVCGYYEPDSVLSVADAVAFGLSYADKTYSPDKFYVEGIIYDVYDTTYGNMHLQDAQGNKFTIYGTYSADGSVRYDAMDVKPVAGDYVKIYGYIGQYSGDAQIQNGWLAAHCTHKDAEGNSLYTGVETTAPDCENDGVMTYTCQCGHSYTEAIPAIGHNYVLGGDGVTYTCSNCGDSYSAFTVSFSVPEGITAVPDMTYTNGIVLPAADSSGDYIFIGWTDVELAAADKVETAPTIYPANETFYTNEACTLYALYAYDTVGGFSGYELADSADSLYDGAKIIIVGANYGYAMSTNQKSNNRGQAAVTIDADNRIAELSDDVQVLTLQKDADTGLWALYTGEAGYLYAAASGSNYLRTQATNDVNGLWEITFNSDKVASVVAKNSSNRNVMQYNNGSALFACYSSASQKALNIFVKQDGTVTYYSTDLGCNHEYVGEVTTAATCTEDGVMTYTCGNCGESYTEVISATGHAWDEGTVTTAPTCATAGVMTYTCANNGCTKEEAIARLTHDFTNGDCVCGHPAPESVLTIEEANQWGLAYDNDVYSSGKYYIEGTIESIVQTTFGNMYIQDAGGNKFYIYGLYSADGSVRFDAMDPQPAVGDTIKIYTVIGTHDGKVAQAKNAWLAEDVDYVNSYNVELTDKIGMNFKLSADVTSATVTFGGETTTVDLTSLPTDESGLRIYNLKMAAVQMTEEVTWLFNGKTEVSYSVRGYADEVLAGEYGANVKAMVQAMLHYGAAAQDYFDYNEGNFANLNMQDTVTNPIQAAEMVPTTGSTAGIVHYGSSLVYRDRVAVRVYFKLTGDAAIGDYTFTANGENAEVNEGSNGLYYVEVADIAPQNLDEAVTVVVNDGLTVTYSPLNYIYRMVNKTDDAVLQNLLQQLYDYYLAADYLATNGADDFETEPDVVG